MYLLSLNLVVGFRERFVQLERKFSNIFIHQVMIRFGFA